MKEVVGPCMHPTPPSPTMTPAISYRTVCTGDALQTVEAHCKTPKEDEKGEALEFFGASMWCKM